jgi:hypothetical protein
MDGGGIHFDFGGEGAYNSVIWSNRTLYADGGGIAVNSSSPTIRNCLVFGNSANVFGFGGGIWSSGSAVHADSCTFWGNIAAESGGGVYVAPGGFLGPSEFRNCIIYSNNAVTGPNFLDRRGDSLVSHCCVYPDLPPGGGNMTNAPLLHSPEKADFHLTAASPCIDAGSFQPWMASGLDLDGDPRVSSGTNDIGCDEACFRAVSITFDTSGVHTAWSAVPGATFQLLTCTNLVPGAWNEASCAGTASSARVECLDTNSPNRFSAYRVLWRRE